MLGSLEPANMALRAIKPPDPEQTNVRQGQLFTAP